MAHTGLADLFWDDMAGKKPSENGGKMCREAMKHEEKGCLFVYGFGSQCFIHFASKTGLKISPKWHLNGHGNGIMCKNPKLLWI
jgi:hypothetical protein